MNPNVELSAHDALVSAGQQAIFHWQRELNSICNACNSILLDPVTLPCNHTFCKLCILRSLDISDQCPRCQLRLVNFNPYTAGCSDEIRDILSTIPNLQTVPTWVLPHNEIPIIKYATVYPLLSHVIVVCRNHYIHMIREILFTGFAKFGIICSSRASRRYGTILTVCDCVNLENGTCIVTAVGTQRFRVRRFHTWHGYETAEIKILADDMLLCQLEINNVIALANYTHERASEWINRISAYERMQIEDMLGTLPMMENYDGELWWSTPNGPGWLWWLIVVLPLGRELKMMLLSVTNLAKRFQLALATLEVLLEN